MAWGGVHSRCGFALDGGRQIFAIEYRSDDVIKYI